MKIKKEIIETLQNVKVGEQSEFYALGKNEKGIVIQCVRIDCPPYPCRFIPRMPNDKLVPAYIEISSAGNEFAGFALLPEITFATAIKTDKSFKYEGRNITADGELFTLRMLYEDPELLVVTTLGQIFQISQTGDVRQKVQIIIVRSKQP